MWTRYDSPQVFKSFVDADGFADTANSQNVGGYGDWRLPTEEELLSLVDERFKPTIDQLFQCEPRHYICKTPLKAVRSSRR